MKNLEDRFAEFEIDEDTHEWLQIRRRTALKIDPQTAEVAWVFARTLDPYGLNPNLPEEFQQVGREFFARAPGSDVWVWFGDLPTETMKSLLEKHRPALYLTISAEEVGAILNS